MKISLPRAALSAAVLFSAGLSAADNLAPSAQPPGSLSPQQVPMFVSIGFDDNFYSGYPGAPGQGGMKWAIDFFKNIKNPAGSRNPATFDDTPARVTFFNTCVYGTRWMAESPVLIKKAWHDAYTDGHEVGNHTVSHAQGGKTRSQADWYKEIQDCTDFLTRAYNPDEVIHSPDPSNGVGVDPAELTGFRSPFLHYNDNTFKVLEQTGFTYDVSIEEGFQEDQSGGDHFWPYTLDNGSPGNKLAVSQGNAEPISNYPGLWELPLHAFMVPPDDKAAQYGLNYSLRDLTGKTKITGLDYNLFYLSQNFKLNKDELLAILKYTLDVRTAGNRAPMLFGGHTNLYHDRGASTPEEAQMRREVIEEFVNYALTKTEVRIVRYDQVVEWMRNPVALETNGPVRYDVNSVVAGHRVVEDKCFAPKWNANTIYSKAGTLVTYDNKHWSNNWYTKGNTPGTPYGPWTQDGTPPCSTVTIKFYGSVTPFGDTLVEEGKTQTYTFTPEPGYKVGSIHLDGVEQTINLANPNNFTIGPVGANAKLQVRFVPVI